MDVGLDSHRSKSDLFLLNLGIWGLPTLCCHPTPSCHGQNKPKFILSDLSELEELYVQSDPLTCLLNGHLDNSFHVTSVLKYKYIQPDKSITTEDMRG